MNHAQKLICIICLVLLVVSLTLPASGAIKLNPRPTKVPAVNVTPTSSSGSWETQSVNTVALWIWTADGEYAVARAGVYLMGNDGSRTYLGQADTNGYFSTRLPAGNAQLIVESPVYTRNGVSWYYSGSAAVSVRAGVSSTADVRLRQKRTITAPPTLPSGS
jgi:hypothetical protein